MGHAREADFRQWAKPPTATEDQRCENAENVVRNAVRSFSAFSERNIEVFAQGSYRNGTNVRANSDVDICVCCSDVCFVDLPTGYTDSYFGLVDASYTYSEFKDDVEQALIDYLGKSAVSRGKKAFDLHANSYRIDADVVPTFEHRRYWIENKKIKCSSGTELHPDGGGKIINWPQQNYENGTAKNTITGTRFKKIVRVIKLLRDEMVSENIAVAKLTSSYLIECLVWNVPNTAFDANEYAENLREVLAHLYNSTLKDETCSEWGEVNELKYLFRANQPWTKATANNFILGAWSHLGF